MGLEVGAEEVGEVEVVDSVDVAAAGPFVEADDVFRVIVGDCKQIAELAFAGRFVAHHECGLHVDGFIATSSHEVDFVSDRVLTCADFVAAVQQMQIDGIFD